ncbi:MAG TPA: hypothetical protein VJZ27_15975 [Aggregatilineales bacterium]|nr:hypothetical protein [Aggregatilineales bacterium]
MPRWALNVAMPEHPGISLHIRYHPWSDGFTFDFDRIDWMLSMRIRIGEDHTSVPLTAGTAHTHEAAGWNAAMFLVQRQYPEWFERPAQLNPYVELEIARLAPDIGGNFSSHYIYQLHSEVLQLRERVKALETEKSQYQGYHDFKRYLNVLKHQTQPQF